MGREIKFRSVHYMNGTDHEFSRFSEWGLIDHTGMFNESCFRSPSTSNMDYVKKHEQYIGINDFKGIPIFEGDIVDIHQTVNGQNKFIVWSCLPKLDLRYHYDPMRKYEYDSYDLLKEDDLSEVEVIGNIHES